MLQELSKFRWSLLALVLANLVPLFGVLWLDWKIFPILLFYWLENVAIWVFNPVKMMLVLRSGRAERISQSLFFAIHFGGFTAAHGLFLFVLFGGGDYNLEQVIK